MVLLIRRFPDFEVGLGRKKKNGKKGEEANAVFVSFFGKRRDGTAYPTFS